MPKRKSNDPFDFGGFGGALNMGMNREWGKVTENIDVMNNVARGYEVERTGRGSDFRRRIAGEPWTYDEVKSGNSPLSPLQRKEKKKRGKNYEVHRYGSNPFR